MRQLKLPMDYTKASKQAYQHGVAQSVQAISQQRSVSFNPNANTIPTYAEIKAEALRLGVPEIDLRDYADAQWFAAHHKFGDTSVSQRAILMQKDRNEGRPRKNGQKMQTLEQFPDEDITGTFNSTLNLCNLTIKNFSIKYLGTPAQQ